MPLSDRTAAEMKPFPEEVANIALHFLQMPPWGKEELRHIQAEVCDPVPEVNARGGRDAAGWRSVYSVVVTEGMCNPMGNLHGGCTSTMIDVISSASIAAISTPTFWGMPMLSGVSISLDCSYFEPAPEGAKLRLAFVVERMSPTLANVRAEVSDWDTGKLYATGTHVKAWRPKLTKTGAKL